MNLPINFKDGIIIRDLSKDDAEKLMDNINSMIKEKGIGLLMNKEVSLTSERDYVNKALKSMKEGEAVYLVAEVDGRIIGSTDIQLKTFKQSHVGGFGIAVAKDYRDVGLGSFLMKAVIMVAKESLKGLKIIRFGVFADNPRAIHVYKKLGFKQVARLPKSYKSGGKFVDELVMQQEVKNLNFKLKTFKQ